MRKIALYMEVPNAHLDSMSNVLDGHFCIASKCLSDPLYFNWFKNYRGGRVILDNGTHEERAPVSCDDLLEIAKATQPFLVFAPDILCDRYDTLQLSREFIARSRDTKAPWLCGVVPQGSDDLELVHCYQEAVEKLKCDYVGLSLMDNRRTFVTSIRKYLRDLYPIPHHMLGLRNLGEIKTWPREVVSMDTVKPLKAAYYDFQLDNCPRGLGVWDSKWVLSEHQLQLCYRNLGVLHVALTLEESIYV